jgi:uncharacterized damage-inducible protein DinB
MTLADRLLRQLKQIRDFSEKVLAAFQTPKDWTRQVAPGTNNAMWFAGHMAMSDNFFISKVDPKRAKKFEGWDKLFGMGSKPTGDPDDYPPVAEVHDAMRERRGVLVELLRGRSDAELNGPPPTGASDFLPDMASIFEMAVWHESLHVGQVTMVRRAMGHRPVTDPAPAEANA